MTSRAQVPPQGETVLVSVITPCFNAEKYIAETIESVLANTAFRSGAARLEYLVFDGGSTDRTCEIVRGLIAQVDLPGVRLELVSEKDGGMYEALAKGMRRATGSIFAYLNAGEFDGLIQSEMQRYARIVATLKLRMD